MSKLRFDGLGAGLGHRTESGDRNSPFNYVVICSCDAELGPLARFRPIAGEVRACACLLCGLVTIVDGTQIARVMTRAAFDAIKKAEESKRAEEKALEAAEQRRA